MMEGMSGYDLLLQIREIRKTLAVVLISAYESIDLVERCEEGRSRTPHGARIRSTSVAASPGASSRGRTPTS